MRDRVKECLCWTAALSRLSPCLHSMTTATDCSRLLQLYAKEWVGIKNGWMDERRWLVHRIKTRFATALSLSLSLVVFWLPVLKQQQLAKKNKKQNNSIGVLEFFLFVFFCYSLQQNTWKIYYSSTCQHGQVLLDSNPLWAVWHLSSAILITNSPIKDWHSKKFFLLKLNQPFNKRH